jgi:gliding motility-associated-like protein
LNCNIRYYTLLLFLLACQAVFASHYRAGEITYEQINGRLYRITAITYTDPNSPANEFTTSITISWGDGQSQSVLRTSLDKTITNNNTAWQNIYVAEHQYSSDGLFLVSLTDPNRVANIRNINGGFSDGTAFYVEALLRIDNSVGGNTSPQLGTLPVFDGCLQFYYTHNPGATDPDGDSLAYKIIPPKQAPRLDVPNYSEPLATDSFKLNPYTGMLYWVKPKEPGLYNIAIRIEEWRRGKLIGYVVRDMQIRIVDCVNDPPTPPTTANLCVQAGDSVIFDVSSSDVNIQSITIRGIGGPFELPFSPAVLSPDPGQGVSLATTRFLWKTECLHIRYRPHTGTLQAVDNFTTPLSNYSTFNIRVIGPKPQRLKTKQLGNGFLVSWAKDTCVVANGYKVYRKIDSTQFTPSSCQTGLPESLGYKLIATVKGNTFSNTDTFYYDDDNGNGLSPLINYCYRIVAIYPSRNDNGQFIVSDPSDSYASEEVCDAIIRSIPILTRATVRFTDILNGAIKVSWIRPDTLDTTVYKAPYQIIVARALFKEATVGAFTNLQTFNYATFPSITDSMFIDSNINTKANQYVYRMEFKYDSSGVSKTIGYSPVAASLFAYVYSTDNTNILSWSQKVPWINETFTLYRMNNTTNLFDSIATTSQITYRDTNLVNGVPYRYYIQSDGFYSFFTTRILNNSQEISGTPIDTIKPCSPLLTVTPPCDNFNSFSNLLNWIPRSSCAEDVLSYNIYYKKFSADPFKLIASLDASSLNYTDTRDTLLFSIAGCYAVTGIDSFGNESNLDNTVCIDNCPFYDIPNVFTPGNIDGKNDLLRPFPYRFIDRISLQIFDRWGQQVFETTDLNIKWDGRDQRNGKECTEGTYFYTCDVYEQYLNELKNNKRRGTIKLNR